MDQEELTWHVMVMTLLRETEEFVQLQAAKPMSCDHLPWGGPHEKAIAENARRRGALRQLMQSSSIDSTNSTS